MKNYVKEAYKAGYEAYLEKRAASLVKSHMQPDDLNKMLLGLAIGGTSGSLIGGKYNRFGGAIGGALAGAIASNPKLFLALLGKGSEAIYNFANGHSRK